MSYFGTVFPALLTVTTLLSVVWAAIYVGRDLSERASQQHESRATEEIRRVIG